MTVKKYSQVGNIQGNYKKTSTTQKAVNTESQTQNIHFMAPTQPFGRTAPNKLLTRKRKRSKHPLRDLRLQRGYTLEELADLTKLSPSYLSRLESGTRRLNADILQRLAHVLSCHPGDLLLTDAQSSKFVMMSRMQNENNEASDGTTSSVRFSTPDLPLYKITSKNSRCVIDFETPQEWVARPHELVGIAGAISFCIDPSNNNFGPRYRSGDHIFAHPTRPLSPQCSILLITQEGEAVVGDFEGWQQESDKVDHCIVSTTELSKNNQLMTKKLSFSNDKIQAIYRIVGLMEAV
jgi:transcriptional regulator with XRE-family HTH domain